MGPKTLKSPPERNFTAYYSSACYPQLIRKLVGSIVWLLKDQNPPFDAITQSQCDLI